VSSETADLNPGSHSLRNEVSKTVSTRFKSLSARFLRTTVSSEPDTADLNPGSHSLRNEVSRTVFTRFKSLSAHVWRRQFLTGDNRPPGEGRGRNPNGQDRPEPHYSHDSIADGGTGGSHHRLGDAPDLFWHHHGHGRLLRGRDLRDRPSQDRRVVRPPARRGRRRGGAAGHPPRTPPERRDPDGPEGRDTRTGPRGQRRPHGFLLDDEPPDGHPLRGRVAPRREHRDGLCGRVRPRGGPRVHRDSQRCRGGRPRRDGQHGHPGEATRAPARPRGCVRVHAGRCLLRAALRVDNRKDCRGNRRDQTGGWHSACGPRAGGYPHRRTRGPRATRPRGVRR